MTRTFLEEKREGQCNERNLHDQRHRGVNENSLSSGLVNSEQQWGWRRPGKLDRVIDVTQWNVDFILYATVSHREFWKGHWTCALARQFVQCCVWIKGESRAIRETNFEVESIREFFFHSNILKYTPKYTTVLKSWERRTKYYLHQEWK